MTLRGVALALWGVALTLGAIHVRLNHPTGAARVHLTGLRIVVLSNLYARVSEGQVLHLEHLRIPIARGLHGLLVHQGRGNELNGRSHGWVGSAAAAASKVSRDQHVLLAFHERAVGGRLNGRVLAVLVDQVYGLDARALASDRLACGHAREVLLGYRLDLTVRTVVVRIQHHGLYELAADVGHLQRALGVVHLADDARSFARDVGVAVKVAADLRVALRDAAPGLGVNAHLPLLALDHLADGLAHNHGLRVLDGFGLFGLGGNELGLDLVADSGGGVTQFLFEGAGQLV